MSHHALIVNPQGLLEILHSEFPIDLNSYLAGLDEKPVTQLAVTTDRGEPVTVHYVADETGHANPRAREVLASLAGVHVYLTGSVGFTGLTPTHLMDLIADVG